ncbi:unannotated protein [freshwater metagenome]|uniref:Unannotated protein n=1 Tax=freshwater metagenome TaxID=449393 RepID=A0A6J6RFF6_9ZZZZ
MTERHRSAVGGDRVTATRLDHTRHDVIPALALGTKSVRFELADQFERKGIVELADINV